MSDIQAQMYEVQSDYLVETGISLPSLKKQDSARAKAMRAMKKMSIGDSFFAPQKDVDDVRDVAYAAVKLMGSNLMEISAISMKEQQHYGRHTLGVSKNCHHTMWL